VHLHSSLFVSLCNAFRNNMQMSCISPLDKAIPSMFHISVKKSYRRDIHISVQIKIPRHSFIRSVLSVKPGLGKIGMPVIQKNIQPVIFLEDRSLVGVVPTDVQYIVVAIPIEIVHLEILRSMER